MIEVSDSHHDQPKVKKPWYRTLYIQVLIAIVLGVLLGAFYPKMGTKMEPLGQGFIKLIKMIIAPVIFISVTVGIASMNDLKKVGRVAGKAFIYFLTFSTLALIIGLCMANFFHPGDGINATVESISAADLAKVKEYQTTAHDSNLTSFILNIIPSTFLAAITGESILQVLFVAILFGVALSITSEKSKPVLDFFQALSNPIFKVVDILMKLAPIGAFGAIAFTIGKYGISSLKNLGELVGLFYATSAFFVIFILGAVAKYNGFSIFKLLHYIKDELLLVLGTSSSESALPSIMRKMENVGCAKKVVGLVIPTGYSFNLDGTNIYMTLAALFIAQAYNIDLSWQQQLTLLLVAMLSSKGAAGVSGAGFITLAATIAVVPEIPLAGMSLIFGIDKFMSECRALTNLIGNSVATIVVSRWEGQLDEQMLKEKLG